MTAWATASAEALAGYAGVRPASFGVTLDAFVLYLPLALILSGVLSRLAPEDGIARLLPAFLVFLRAVEALRGATLEGGLKGGTLALAALYGFWVLTSREGSRDQPATLFAAVALSVCLPILGQRAVYATNPAGGERQAAVIGVTGGLLLSAVLRRLVWRHPAFGLLAAVSLLTLVAPLRFSLAEADRRTEGTRRADDNRPDILLVVLDTLRAQPLGALGTPVEAMPNLTRFARESRVFDRAYTNGSWTVPAHASLFSGLRVTRHRYDNGFDPSERTPGRAMLAARLLREGYSTGAVVANWLLHEPETPLLDGFEWRRTDVLRPLHFEPWFFSLLARFGEEPGLQAFAARYPSPFMRAGWITDRALEFWGRADSRPRFLFVNYMETHMPYAPAAEDRGAMGPQGLFTERAQHDVLDRHLTSREVSALEVRMLGARYMEAARTLDRDLGRLLQRVLGGPRLRPAVVIVTSDHGELLGEHGRLLHPGTLDEEIARVPLMIHDATLAPGRDSSTVQLLDLFGFMTARAEVPVEPGLDWKGFGEREEALVEQRPAKDAPVAPGYPRGNLTALIRWPLKYIEGPSYSARLFDLSSDPLESRNIAATEPTISAEMRGRLRGLSSEGEGTTPSRLDSALRERLRALGYVR